MKTICFWVSNTIDEKSAFVQVMRWHQIGEKPLPEQALIVGSKTVTPKVFFSNDLSN